MDSTTNQPSGSSSSSSDAADRSAALSALQAQILSAFDNLVQYSTTLQAEFGGEADPRMLAFTSDIAVHLPTSLNNLEDARQRIRQNLSSSSADLQVVLHSAASQTDDNDGQNAGQQVSHSVPSSPNASRATSDAYLDGNGRPRAFPTTFFPTPSKNTRHWTSAKGKGKAKAPAQGTDAPSADAEGANEDEDAEAVEQSLSVFCPPSDDYPAVSTTAKGKGKARAIEQRDDEDTAGPSVPNVGRAGPRFEVAHAAADAASPPSTGSDAPQAQASNVPQTPRIPPVMRPLRRADAFSGKSHPEVFWASEWGAPPSHTPPPPPPPPPPPSPPKVPRASAQAPATGSTTIHTADGVPLRRSTRHMGSRANAAEEPPVASSSRLPAEPARRATKRRAREDADADEDEDDGAAEASPKKKAKQTRAKKPRPAKRGSRK
ncbi:hypothetical protein EYR36_002014 [Pleurotus pulmonarius]|nr:hypothetical protein EYR36_002014 [Pleurotus pulmonarius]KAF4588237.1 hypothetical protein EYR38_010204 [Pleurotus pulmonarius]